MTVGVPPQIDGLAYVRLLGSGGFGDVFLYENVGLHRQEALKVIRGSDLSGSIAQRFMAEANAMARLDHPHIVPVYGTGMTGDGRPYLAMKFYPGGTMEERAVGGRLPLAEALRTGIQIGGALEIAHRAGFLHRDIKPSNILVDRYGNVGLTDFGVAAQMATDDGDDDVGVSIPWSPKEMLYSATRGSAQSDVYSLAATLWHLVVGRSPFEIPGGDNSRAALMLRVRDSPAPVTGRADIPPSLDALLRQAMAKDAHLRPRTMADFVRSLQLIESEQRLPRTTAYLDPGPRSMPTEHPPGPPGPEPEPGQAGTVVRPAGAGTVRPSADLPYDQRGGPSARPGVTSGPGPVMPQASTQIRAPGAAPARPSTPAMDPTQVRARVSQVTIEQGDDPQPRGRVKGVLIGLGVVLLLVCGGGAYALLARDGSAAETPAARATVSDAPPVDEEAPPPGPVTITVTRAGGQVDFTWTYSDALTTDTYRLRVGDGGETTSVQPELRVGEQEAEVCLSVIVVRADGSNPTREFPQPTCG